MTKSATLLTLTIITHPSDYLGHRGRYVPRDLMELIDICRHLAKLFIYMIYMEDK